MSAVCPDPGRPAVLVVRLLTLVCFVRRRSGGKEGKWKSLGNLQDKWDRRFFVLDLKGTLAYYKTEADVHLGNAAGVVDCRGGALGQFDDEDNDQAGYIFTLNTKNRVLTMRADTDEDAEGWARVIGPVVAKSMKMWRESEIESPHPQRPPLAAAPAVSAPGISGPSSASLLEPVKPIRLPPPTAPSSGFTDTVRAVARAVNPSALMTSAKKKIYASAKRMLSNHLSRVYTENLKLTITPVRA